MKRGGFTPRTAVSRPKTKKSSAPKSKAEQFTWTPKKSPESELPTFNSLPPIFSGTASNQLWDAIYKLGGENMTAEEVHDAIYHLGCSMQALEARLVTAFKQLHKKSK